MEKREYTEKDFYVFRKKAIIISLIFFSLDWICAIGRIVKFSDFIDWVIICIGLVIMPVLLVIGWGGCIRCYFALQKNTLGEQYTLSRRVWLCISIAIMFFFGLKTFYGVRDVLNYATNNLNILDGLYHCVAIKAGIAAGWIFCWICSIKLRGVISTRGKKLKKLVVLVTGTILAAALIHITDIQEEYISKYTDHIWIIRMMEYYDEHGTGADVVPFSSL